jgi:hypothetical protein
MGRGESYWMEFGPWFIRQSPDAQTQYIDQYPEPAGWEGFYSGVVKGFSPKA